MARIERIVVPGMPHHVVQRDVRKMDIFFSDDDRRTYLDLLSEQGKRFGVRYLAWCLMTNHMHMIAIPEQESSPARGIGEAHRLYTRRINFRQGWRGYLFQGRFHSFLLDGNYLLAAVRYVLRNPVRAGLVDQPWDHPWSAARWLTGLAFEDPLASPSEMLDDIVDWPTFLLDDAEPPSEIRKHTLTGRPLGREGFTEQLEQLTGRSLRLMKPGPKSLN